MARTLKVTKEKAIKERAQEAGDKKKKDMQKLRMENRERAKQIKERKDKQLKLSEVKNWENRGRHRGGCKP